MKLFAILALFAASTAQAKPTLVGTIAAGPNSICMFTDGAKTWIVKIGQKGPIGIVTKVERKRCYSGRNYMTTLFGGSVTFASK